MLLPQTISSTVQFLWEVSPKRENKNSNFRMVKLEMYTIPCHYLSRLFVAHYQDIGFSIIAQACIILLVFHCYKYSLIKFSWVYTYNHSCMFSVH